MCFSAQVSESFQKYLRATGAEMDIEQFLELISLRAQGRPIRIPRAVDRWFNEPRTPREAEARDLIAKFRADTVRELQQELFAQRKRLADAVRKLAVKTTKAAQESKRIATAKVDKVLRDLPLYGDWTATTIDARIFPFTYAPIVMHDGGRNVIRLARYHLRQPGAPELIDRKFPGLYNARRDNIDRFWRGQFGQTHALMLAESFYENVARDGANAVLHFVPRPHDTMLVACLYGEWRDPVTGEQLLSFAAITDEPPAEVAAAGHDRMIVNIRPENVQRWLTPQGRSDQELQQILIDRQRPFYEHVVLAA